ncbi:Uncharacterised protein [Mycobacteroides abscessus subsp. abscessus]|uniref:XRE family transcriptional regulator n=1 Tax=Gordonia jacobaea TaxID=122202 RepID=A0ABR5IBL5_9ACTN|nr:MULTISPECIES: hypothetical protein [Gordonia]KNA90987.1 XRE family transcriptional regulator [Gordonia jacobaea]MCM3897496.1 hypothetical protein [Gordonia sputi]SKZ91140.1 Uncharacterised protein [Mycobacteroides abscessus subsp. abscessus]
MSDLTDCKQALLDELSRLVDERFAMAEDAGVDAEVFADTQRIATAMAAALPSVTVHDQRVGPFYDTAGLTSWLGVSKQAIAKRVKNNTLIGCQLESGTWVYPTWQFTDAAKVDQHLLQVWQILREHTNAWTAVLWMCSPNPALNDETAVRYATGGGDEFAEVLAAAHADAARWAA